MSLGIMAESMSWGTIEGWRRGPWTAEEDRLLIEYVKLHGDGRWNSVARLQGLKRNGKSCRLRWVNYLRPDLKRGQITPHEETIILDLHAIWGNRWSTIARSLPGRTDNEIKNYWRTHFKKEVKASTGTKSKARMLRKQQFQLLQQQQQYETEMKRSMPCLDDENEHIRMQIQQHNMSEMHPSVRYDQEQGYLCATTLSFSDYDASMPASSSSDQDFFYDGSLWNLDDFQGNLSAVSAATRATLQSLATPLYNINCSY